MHPSLTIYDPSASDAIRTDFEVETVADDCRFTEGPVWNPEGFYLFSDITANCIYRWQPGKKREVVLENSGTDRPDAPYNKGDMAGSNGLAYSAGGALLVCRHGSHDVAVWNGALLESLTSAYEGRPFNSPNDIVADAEGRVFFSDPPYGLKEGKLNPQDFQPVAGVYCWQKDQLARISDRYQYPNGVCLSPDGSRLYISSNKPFERFISEHDPVSGRFLQVFCEENSDGIKCSGSGHFFLATNEGLVILDPEGRRIARLLLPTTPANLCFGGPASRDLFITARERVYLIRDFLIN